ncbi:MAG: DUF711 family protein [Streptosporangiales bacterium]|nr:DUF711 family protein [Streptosporangiales bacterium]
MDKPPVRTITLGIAERHPLAPDRIERAAPAARRAETGYRDAGYEVQTLRLSTRPVFDDLAGWPPAEIVSYAHTLQTVLDDLGIAFCSLGPAPAARPDFPLDRLEPIADLLVGAEALNCTVQLADPEHGIRADAALPAARVMLRLAEGTKEGFGNFRFAALACVEPGGPFFPAAYHRGAASLTIGLQGAGIVAEALRGGTQLEPAEITRRVRDALTAEATPAVRLGQQVAERLGLRFGGIDLSPAPAGEDSIAAAMERCGIGQIGSPGTLTVAAALTGALHGTDLPTCGYNGLMLPVLEDATLGRRWEQGHVDVHDLLCYSAVCGTGLDTIPLPGDSSPDEIARLLLDVATLAVRLRKPLSARLFPVPGKLTGERTAFTSPYLTNTCVKW